MPLSSILEFINIFSSPSNQILFTDCACYWFSEILHRRFSNSVIVYDPHQVHFATKINGKVYDIRGLVEDDADYVEWDEYLQDAEDADIIIQNCIELERR